MINLIAPLSLYVDPVLGADVPGAGFFPSTPAKTPPFLIDQLPETLPYLVTMQLAAGSYAGFLVSGFLAKPALGQTSAGLNIVGAYVPPAGFAPSDLTGTITAITPGNPATPAFTVIEDNTKSWTPDAFRRKTLQVGASRVPIISNDATHFVIASTAAVATVGASYSIVDKGSVITTPITNGTGQLGFGFFSNRSPQTTSFSAEAVDVNCASSTGVSVRDNLGAVRLKNCSVLGAVPFAFDFSGFAQSALASGCVAAPNSGNTGLVLGHGNTVFSGGLVTCPSGSLGIGVQAQGHGPTVSLSSSQLDNSTFGVKVFTTGGAHFEMSGTTIDTNHGSQAFLASSQGHNEWGTVVLRATGLKLQNASVGLQMGGAVRAWIDSLQGTGNTTGVQIDRGAICQVGAASGITGTTEVSMDGAGLTLAAMRALTPKLISNPYNSMIFE